MSAGARVDAGAGVPGGAGAQTDTNCLPPRPRGRLRAVRRAYALILGLLLAAAAVGGLELRQRAREQGSFQRIPGLKYVMTSTKRMRVGWQEGLAPPPRRPGVARVLAVGDSVTAGVGVKVKEAWPARLGDALGADVAEVINFGENGWDASQVAALLETRVDAWEPDLVVWGTYANDPFPTRVLTSSTSGDLVYVDSEVPEGARIVPARLQTLLLERSALFRHVQGVRYVRWVSQDDEAPEGWYAAQVARVAAWSSRSGVPVLVVAIPAHVTMGPGCDDSRCDAARSWYELVREGLRGGELPWIDAERAWAGKGPFLLPELPDPDHPNAEGHQLLADFVAGEVRARLAAP